MNQQVETFTYCGDLVGVTSLYQSTPEGAYNLLNVFYNEVFSGLSAFHREDLHNHEVTMFSDTNIVT